MLLRNVATLSFLLAACGPAPRPHGGGDDDDNSSPDSGVCTPSAENTVAACSDSADTDCDGYYDCSDPDCSGVGDCPVCGMVQHPLSQPLALPDGTGADSGNFPACTTDVDCSGTPAIPNCINNECHESYTSSLHFDGFAAGQTITDVSNIVSVCVNMEHSWLRDLQIDLVSPSGQRLALQQFLGQDGDEVFMGSPDDNDDVTPNPGTGAQYCWTPTATKPTMLQYASQNGGLHYDLPPGDYSPAQPFAGLVGATLNGDWKILVTDLWEIDNGFIFSWEIAFDPAIVEDCSGPVIQ